MAFHAILQHELFHFAVDYAVAQCELITDEAWWLPAKTAFRAATPNYCLIEEKLANAYMLRAFRTMKSELRYRGKQEALRRFTRRQPPGYQDGWRIRSEDWERELEALAERADSVTMCTDYFFIKPWISAEPFWAHVRRLYNFDSFPRGVPTPIGVVNPLIFLSATGSNLDDYSHSVGAVTSIRGLGTHASLQFGVGT